MTKLTTTKLTTYSSDILSHNATVKAELRALLDELIAKSVLAVESANTLIAFNDADIQRTKDIVAAVAGTIQGSFYGIAQQMVLPVIEPPPV